MNELTIRQVVPSDVEALLSIYAQYIPTSVTFETVLPSRELFLQRIEKITAHYPYLVAELNGQIVGYAYAHPQAERAAFRWNAELSVYVSHDSHHQGVGHALYATLIPLLRERGLQTLYALITIPNETSLAFHRKFGIYEVARFPHAGFKCGAWHSLAHLILPIGDYPECPEEPTLEPQPFNP